MLNRLRNTFLELFVLFLLMPMLCAKQADQLLYQPYQHLLKTYVNDAGMVDYKGIQKDKAALTDTLSLFVTLEKSTFESFNNSPKLKSSKAIFPM